MYGNENNISILVHDLHYLPHPSLVILHPYETPEYSHTVIYMDHIITNIESSKVIKGKLLALFHSPSDAHSVETVEDFMVRITAYLILVIDETRMDVLSGNEFRNQSFIFNED